MKFNYEKKFRYNLKLSERQLEQMSALHCVSWFMDISSNHLKDLENINPEWLEQQRYKDFTIWDKKRLLDTGRIKVRKAKKGYVIEMRFNWRSKGIKTIPIVCIKCKKVKPLNWHNFCEKCTKEIGVKKIYNYWRTGK